jgi:hypothetical protein
MTLVLKACGALFLLMVGLDQPHHFCEYSGYRFSSLRSRGPKSPALAVRYSAGVVFLYLQLLV